ncbi:MAG: 2-hydroxyacid dehydrogenase [Azospirillaceae bacterium]
MTGGRHIVLYGRPVIGRAGWLEQALGPAWSIETLDYAAPRAAREAAFVQADAVVCVRYDASVPPAPRLRLVQVPGVGTDEIDLEVLPGTATLCNVRGHGPGAAEFVILHLLEWRQRSRDAEASFRKGSWEASSRFGAPPRGELFGATVTLIGYGEIGRALADRLEPFGVRLRVANRSALADAARFDRTGGLDQVAELVDGADFAVVCVALTAETRGLVGEDVLMRLGPNGVLVNIARGPVVDEAALYAALREGRLGGAVIDVWYRYPEAEDPDQSPAHHPFGTLGNVVMTPHVSGWTEGTVARRWADILTNLRQLETGGDFINVVRRARPA